MLSTSVVRFIKSVHVKRTKVSDKSSSQDTHVKIAAKYANLELDAHSDVEHTKLITCLGRRLVVAAQAGAAAEAEEVIEDMRAAGLAPGPRAYHGLIFSHAKVARPRGSTDILPPHLDLLPSGLPGK